MIKLENCEVMGWEVAIRELYKGKGVRWVYPNFYEAYIPTASFSLVVHIRPRNKQEKRLRLPRLSCLKQV